MIYSIIALIIMGIYFLTFIKKGKDYERYVISIFLTVACLAAAIASSSPGIWIFNTAVWGLNIFLNRTLWLRTK